jgi:regulation of enolase protein 1 (concanavalin A-like superfamily)
MTPTVTPTPGGGGPVPAPWTDQDIGAVGFPGSATLAGGTYGVSASGTDIDLAADQFHYAFEPLSGDGTISVRVTSIQNTNPWAKAGVMIRETLAANSTHASMFLTPGNGVGFQRRIATGALQLHTPGAAVTAPYWVRIVRAGNTFSGYSSPDGTIWTLVGSDTIPMATAVYVGLAVTSHDNTVLGGATLDSLGAPAFIGMTGPAPGASFAAPAGINLSAAPYDASPVTRVDFYNGLNLLGSSTTAPYTFAWAGVPAGSYSLTARGTDSLGAVFTSAAVGVTVNPAGQGLPAPWLDQDVGAPGAVGSASASGSTFAVNGGGVDIWDAADSFHFVYQILNGNATVVARVATQQNTDPWAKTGVMIRETLAAGSKQALMALTPGNGLSFQRRPTTGGLSASTAGGTATAPYWVKLVRNGNTFTGYKSTDGTNWTSVGSATITMGANVYVGVADTSHNNALLCTSTLDGVVASPGVN